MIDFDDYFAKRLDEEHSFPNRERNWRIVQKRLNLSDNKITPYRHDSLRNWRIAATVLFLVTGWLAWALVSERQEISELHRQMAEMIESKYSEKDIREISTAERSHPDVHPLGESAELPPGEKAVSKQAAPKNGGSLPAIAAPAGDGPVPGMVSSTPGLPFSVGQNPEAPDKATYLEPIPSILRQVVASRREMPGIRVAIAATQITRPVPEAGCFRLGITGTAGVPLPHEKGVSLITGNGFRAEYPLTKKLWLTASADWMRFEVSTDRFVARFHHHDHPPDSMQVGPQNKLVKVESTQRQQQFGIGLRYAPELRSWLKPSIRATYTLVRTSPETISFQFEKPMKNEPPEFLIQKNDAKRLNSALRLGAGVEHEAAHWVFGFWAEYSRNLAGVDSGFDALMLQGGILYRFN